MNCLLEEDLFSMKKNNYKERKFDLLGGNIDDMEFDKKWNLYLILLLNMKKKVNIYVTHKAKGKNGRMKN